MSSVTPFSNEWLQIVASEFDESLLSDSVAVSVVVLGGPDGDVNTSWKTGGALSATNETVADEEADLALTIPWDDAMAFIRGELPAAVAYMQGRLKGSGDMALLLRLLEAAETNDWEAWRSRSLARTGASD